MKKQAAERSNAGRAARGGAGVWGFTFLVLDLGLDGGDGVAALDLQRDGLPRQRLHKDLHLRRPVARFLLSVALLPSGRGGGFGVRWRRQRRGAERWTGGGGQARTRGLPFVEEGRGGNAAATKQ